MNQVQNDKDGESALGNQIRGILCAAMGVAGTLAMAAQASLELSALGSPAPGAIPGPIAALQAPVAPRADAVRLRETFSMQERGDLLRDTYSPTAALASTTKEMK